MSKGKEVHEFLNSLEEKAKELDLLILAIPRDVGSSRDELLKCYEALERAVNAGPGEFLIESHIKFHRREK